MTRDEIISSLLDQAQDKDCLANNDETSIFTEDAKALREAVDLLKAQEQESILVSIKDSDSGITHWYVCGACNFTIQPGDRFCHECGKAVKWK